MSREPEILPVMLGVNHLQWFDYLVVAGTLLFSVIIGVYYATKGRKSGNSEEYLVGNRSMGAIPVAASILVSYLSAITILGYPAEVYAYGSQIFLMTLLGVITNPLAILVFVRVMHDLKLTSAYKYLELRFNAIEVRWLGSLIFIAQLLFISGIVLYAPSIVMETMMGVPMWISVILIGIVGTGYTSFGGIKAVVWTDVFQFFMIFIGMSAIVVKGIYSAGGVYEMFSIANERGRLDLFNWTIDPFMRHNTLNIVIGNVFTGTLFVTHQPVLQRYCALPTFKDAAKSIIWSYIFGFVTVGLVILTGIAIFAHFANCDPLTAGGISKSDQIVPYFVVQELSFIPGMMGLFAAVIFSAVLSTISSTLNSLAAVTWEDFLSKISYFQNLGDYGQGVTYKLLAVIYGAICVSLAFVAQHFGSIFQAAITVVTAAIGVLGSVFLMGVLMPFVNKRGATTGLIVGVVAVCFIVMQSIFLQKDYNINPKLPFEVNECPAEIAANTNFNATTGGKLFDQSELKWPRKLFSISYILYSFIGGMITIVVGVIVSLATNGLRDMGSVNPAHLHPWLRPKNKEKSAQINQAFQNDVKVHEDTKF